MVEMHGKKKPKVLMVENNPVMREILQRFLRTKFPDVDVHQAGDGREAFAQIHDSLPDLILMDLQLPGMDGLKATQLILNDENLKEIPVLALTSYAMETEREKAQAAGCAGYITKPIDTRSFSKMITEYIR